MKLEKFKEKDHKKKITIGISIILVLLVAGIIVYRSFAFYEEKKAFDVIKGQVPAQNYDLMFSFYVEDENGKNIYQDTMPEKKDYTVTIECNNGATGEWDNESWGPRITNLTSTRTKCKLVFQENIIDDSQKEVTLEQKNEIQEYKVLATGIYKLEVWGAQGGYNGGKGGYSVGYKQLNKNDILYIATGGQGQYYNSTHTYHAGGYNGGGSCFAYNHGRSINVGAGGGATHIALNSNRGELKNYVNNKEELLIVAGGGGGSSNIENNGTPGTGGGLSGGTNSGGTQDGNVVYGGTQTAGGQGVKGAESGSFGQGGTSGNASSNGGCGGGGGYFGGAGGRWRHYAGAGGSGYIGGVPTFEYNGTTYAPTTTSGQNAGNGKAKITFIDYL